MSEKRSYEMKARAAGMAATRERILTAAEVAYDEMPFDQITLAWIAERAGVSVQTVIRHFGTKQSLFVATLLHTGRKMQAGRRVPSAGDTEEIVDILVDHYEEFGDRILRSLAQEDQVQAVGMVVKMGRVFHVEWCKRAFKPDLQGIGRAERKRRLAQISAITDIYMWKILRRDRGLRLAETKRAMVELIEALGADT